MDIGVISVRYARALLKAAAEQGKEASVYAAMQSLAKSYLQVPQLRKVIENPMMDNEVKAKLLATATATSEPLVDSLIQIVLREGRTKMLQFIANSYITLYRKQNNIINGRLITPAPVGEATVEKMRKMVEQNTNGTVDLETDVDPELIGGFILEYDTYRMDASVKTKLREILATLK